MTGRTVDEAVKLQAELIERGVPAATPDVLVDSNARELGGTFATVERRFGQNEVREVLAVAAYDPY